MFDIQLIRDNPQKVQEGLEKKKCEADLGLVLKKDKQRRSLQKEIDDLRARQNIANDEISELKKQKKDVKNVIASVKTLSLKARSIEPKLKKAQEELKDLLIRLPNLPHESVPAGDEKNNKVVRSWGEAPRHDFKPKTHIELGESLQIIDFKRGAKISGANFIVLKGLGARLERALIHFMIDVHTGEHGYTEVLPPVVVNSESMTGTGQLPKMDEDMYRLRDEGLYLIPTAEVPVTNLYRDEILAEEDLPVYHTAFSSCFRREAGSYGKDTKGMIRVHQFEKVELVKFVKPENSYNEHETLVKNAEAIFQKLNIPYRVSLLASGDLSFAAAKCYDIEVYASGLDKWLEASSCSNFEDFQARRANIRFKGGTTKKPAFVHTLNGSGVALPRTIIALLENNQTREGDVVLPPVLVPYMGGVEKITKPS